MAQEGNNFKEFEAFKLFISLSNKLLSGGSMRKTDKSYKKLISENRRLKKRVRELEQRLYKSGDNSALTSDPLTNKYYSTLAEISRKEMLNTSQSFYRYLLNTLKSSSFYRIYYRLLKFWRRLRMIRTILNIVTVIFFTFIVGTLTVGYGIILILLLPVVMLLIAVLPIISKLRSKKSNEYLQEQIGEKNVFVLFPMRSSNFENSTYFKNNILDLCGNSDSVVIIVSPYYFKLVNGYKRKDVNVYCNTNGENIFLIRKYYYFIFFREILKKLQSRVNLIF